MLIGVIVIFLICQGPALVSRIMYAFRPMSASTKPGFTLNEVGNFFVLLNSAINIVPYYLFGRKFRNEFWRLFCACCFDKDELRRIIRSYSLSVDQRRTSQYDVIEMNGSTQSKQKTSSTHACGGHIDCQCPQHTHSNQRSGQPSSGCIVQSDTADNSVAIPLIHGASSSASSAGLVSRDASKDSLRTFAVLFSSNTQILATNGIITTTNRHGQCMTATSGPYVRGPEWSAV